MKLGTSDVDISLLDKRNDKPKDHMVTLQYKRKVGWTKVVKGRNIRCGHFICIEPVFESEPKNLNRYNKIAEWTLI